jgi:hypothetical protein
MKKKRKKNLSKLWETVDMNNDLTRKKTLKNYIATTYEIGSILDKY